MDADIYPFWKEPLAVLDQLAVGTIVTVYERNENKNDDGSLWAIKIGKIDTSRPDPIGTKHKRQWHWYTLDQIVLLHPVPEDNRDAPSVDSADQILACRFINGEMRYLTGWVGCQYYDPNGNPKLRHILDSLGRCLRK